ncbi:hypothetical protein [Methanothrix sp.]|jgi:hypothetical protein
MIDIYPTQALTGREEKLKRISRICAFHGPDDCMLGRRSTTAI